MIKLIKVENRQGVLTLANLLTLMACIFTSTLLCLYFNFRFNKVLGVMVMPLGFCSAATLIALLTELRIRLGFSRFRPTSSPLVRRSLITGAAFGIAAGILFYYLAAKGMIPTNHADSKDNLAIPACLFGVSLALTIALIFMAVEEASKASASQSTTPNPMRDIK